MQHSSVALLRYVRLALLAALCAVTSVYGQPIPPPGPQPPPSPQLPDIKVPDLELFAVRRLCVVHDDGRAVCVTRGQIQDEFTPEFATRIQQLFERLYGELGLDKSQRGLGSCGRSGWATFSAGITGGARKGPGSAPSSGARLAATADVEAAVQACRAGLLHEVGVGDFTADGGYQAWVESVLERVDQQVAGCKDSGHPLIAASSSQSPLTQDMDLKFGKKFSAKDGGWIYEQFEGRLSKSEKNTALAVMNAVQSMEQEIAEDKKKADAIKDPVEREKAQKEVAAKESWLEQFVLDFIDFILNFGSAPAEPVDADSVPEVASGDTGAGGGAAQPCDPEVGCGKSCAAIQARWQNFKAMCEQSQWKAYNCVAFLRKANGCVDAARINPGPDGDLTCPERRTKREMQQEAYAQQCQRKGWIMIPVEGATRGCVMPELGNQLPAKFDICNDPRAMPGPDQCLGGGIGVDTGNPEPRPMPEP